MPPLHTLACGRVPYERALEWMRALVRRRHAGDLGDVLITLEHDPVYTAGRRANVTANVLGAFDIPVVPVERGGDVTYHGPGQLVAYPIVELEHPKAVRAYIDALEQACVATAAAFGVAAEPDRSRTGVWVGEDKLAAIGIKLNGRVTSHGLAFNVATNLEHFRGIIPCGLHGAGVCSLRSLGVEADVADVQPHLVAALARELGRRPVPVTLEELGLDAPESTGFAAPSARG